MKNETGTNPKLHLVSAFERKSFESGLTPLLGYQTPLFPTLFQNLLVFVDVPRAGASQFVETLEMLRPNIVFELRKIPRFDFWPLTRERAFNLFDHHKIKYMDVASQLTYQPLSGPGVYSYYLGLLPGQPYGPIMMLTDFQVEASGAIEFMAKQVQEQTRVDWNVLFVPDFVQNPLVQSAHL